MKVKKELVSIKRVILVWFLLIICGNASNLNSEAAAYKHLGKEKQLIIKNGYGSKIMKSSTEIEPRSKALKELHEVDLHSGINVSKGKEGIGIYNQTKKANKGVYGGGDILRPKSKKGGASSLCLKSSSSMALKTLALGFLFVVVVFF